MTLLESQGVSVQFGGVAALSDVSLELHEGEVLGLIGPNGAGKTTLLNAISGLVRPSGGTLLFEGRNVTRMKPHRIARLGIARTFQVVQPFKRLTVRENTAVGAMFVGQSGSAEADFDAADEALERVGLSAKARHLPGQLTLSERKRLELARALAMRPKLLLLDEVMAGLNHREMDQIITLIQAINQQGQTIIVVEHVMKAIMAVCHRIVVLQYGRKIADNAPGEIVRDEAVVKAYLGERFAKRQHAGGQAATENSA